MNHVGEDHPRFEMAEARTQASAAATVSRGELEAVLIASAHVVEQEREVAAVLVGSFVADEETGEVIEWPEDCSSSAERIAYVTAQHREADRQVKAWEFEKAVWARLMGRGLAEAGVKSLRSDYGNAISVAASTVRKAPATNVQRAATEEIITDEQASELLLRAAKDLDVDEIEAWIAEQPESLRRVLRIVLISLEPRRGYAYSREPAKPSPRITAKENGQ